MQFRISNNDHDSTTATGSGSQFLRVSSALLMASSVLLALPMTSDAFVPSSISSSQHQSSYSSTTSTRLFYTMPDVTNMKAREMRQELESYGIKTNTLFDKREFEEALIEARRHYEQTLDDVMASTRPKKKKVQVKRNTVNYNRSQHERIHVNDVGGGGGGSDQQKHQRRYNGQQQAEQHRPHRHYQAAPDPMGGFTSDPMGGGFHTYPNGAQNGGGNRHRNGSTYFEEDPLFAHEAESQHHQQHQPYDQQQEFYQEYEVGGRQQQQTAQATYDDPALEMKYQNALQEAYNMKVENLQQELNCRGISTKYCMVFRDFCQEYAKAIADDREEIPSSSSSEGDDDSENNNNVEDEGDKSSAAFGDDDDDYDPLYRDVVMQKYDPSMWC